MRKASFLFRGKLLWKNSHFCENIKSYTYFPEIPFETKVLAKTYEI
jgi:hypothetical protein